MGADELFEQIVIEKEVKITLDPRGQYIIRIPKKLNGYIDFKNHKINFKLVIPEDHDEKINPQSLELNIK